MSLFSLEPNDIQLTVCWSFSFFFLFLSYFWKQVFQTTRATLMPERSQAIKGRDPGKSECLVSGFHDKKDFRLKDVV